MALRLVLVSCLAIAASSLSTRGVVHARFASSGLAANESQPTKLLRHAANASKANKTNNEPSDDWHKELGKGLAKEHNVDTKGGQNNATTPYESVEDRVNSDVYQGGHDYEAPKQPEQDQDEGVVSLQDLPKIIRDAVEKVKPGATIIAAEIETEHGNRHYEVTVVRNKKWEVEVAMDGGIIEVEEVEQDEEDSVAVKVQEEKDDVSKKTEAGGEETPEKKEASNKDKKRKVGQEG